MQPVFLIGALRSGTKILRDTIGIHPDVFFLSYEPEYIWRLGGEKGRNYDELIRDDASECIKNEIRKKIHDLGRNNPIFLEKSVANCLRLEFIDEIFPEAKFIYLMRNGLDNVESTYRQWQTPPSFSYIFNKLLEFPWWSDPSAFRYLMHYAQRAILQKLAFKKVNVKTWGIRYEGIENDLKTKSLLEVCAKQWAESISSSYQTASKFPQEKVIFIRYENFVENPLGQLEVISKFLDLDFSHFLSATDLLNSINSRSVGSGKKNLTSEQQTIVRRYIDDQLSLLGYN